MSKHTQTMLKRLFVRDGVPALIVVGCVTTIFVAAYVFAASSGPNSPSTLADDSGTGTVAWTNASNAGASDNSYATVTIGFVAGHSHYLKATNFGFDIPSDVTIDGIVAEVEAKKVQMSMCMPMVRFGGVRLVKGGTITGNNKSGYTELNGSANNPEDCGTSGPAPTDEYYSFGGSSDLWGVSLTPSDVNASNFGFVANFQSFGGSMGVQLDHMRITVYYSTAAVAPGAPTSLTATKQTNARTIDLSWTAPADDGGGTITGYKIERESPIDGGFSTLVADTGTSATTYSNTNLTANTQYNYRVSAINSAGAGDPSNEDDDTTNNVPGSPTSLTATASGFTVINLSWAAPASNGGSTVTGYKIERETPVGGGFSTIVNNTASTGTAYSNTGLSSGTQYNYRVSAINAIGTGSVSTTANATTVAPACGDGIINGDETCDDGGESLTCDDDCTAVSCGDSNINAAAGEECDDGSANGSANQCTLTCKKTYCGDGVLQTPNGNGQSEICEPALDGTCSNSCTPAAGVGGTTTITSSSSSSRRSSSSASRLPPPPNCGNGVLETSKGEQCDDGIYNGLSPTCDRWCQKQFCGNGILEPASGEECEPLRGSDGALLEAPKCGSSCTVPVCDDKNVCTGGCRLQFLPLCAASSSSAANVDLNIDDGVDVSSASSSSSSSSSEDIVLIPTDDTSSASSSSSQDLVFEPLPGICGDGIVQADEECDGGEENNMLGLGCTPDCRVSVCGNAMLEPGEECDDGVRNTDNQPDSCSTLCLLPRCGDAITDMNFGELCDGGFDNSDVIADACRTNCVPARCGDGVTDTGEQCDEGSMGGLTCTSQCTYKTLMSASGDTVGHGAAPDEFMPVDSANGAMAEILLSVGGFLVIGAGLLKWRRVLRWKKSH